MRRLAIATLAVTAVALTGCAAGGDGGDAGENEPVEISYAYWGDENQQRVWGEVIDAFEEEYPWITVDRQPTPFDQYFTKLNTTIAGDNAPDLFLVNAPSFPLYANNDVVQPIGQFVEEHDIDMSLYPQAITDLYTFDGDQYGIPLNMSTMAMWYNKDLFDKAGVEYPTADWTWDDLFAAAEAITDPAANVYGIAAPLTNQRGFYNTIAQAGGYVLSEDRKKSGYGTPEAAEGIEFWTNLIQDGFAPTLEQSNATPADDMFISGQVAMVYSISTGAAMYYNSDVKDVVDVVPLPAGPAGEGNMNAGISNVISASTEHPEEAFLLLEFMTSIKGQEMIAQGSGLIPAIEGSQTLWLESMPEYDLQVYIDGTKDGVPMPISLNTSAWTALENEYLAPVWAGERPAAEALKELAAAMEAKLAEE